MNDSFIRQIGNSNNIDETIGCSLYRFLNEIDTEECNLGDIVASSADKARGQYFRVLGVHYYGSGTPVQSLSKSNVGIEAKRKLGNFGDKTAKQLVREFISNNGIEDKEAIKILDKIEANKLVIMPLKPKMTCKVYVEDKTSKNRKKADVIQMDTGIKTEGPSDEALRMIEEENKDKMLDNKELDALMEDDNATDTGYEKKTGSAFRAKRSEIVQSKEIGNNWLEKTVDIESVQWEINKQTGQLECYVLTNIIEGTAGKRVKASIEEYGVTLLLNVVENTIMPTFGANARKFIQISRFGYIKPVKTEIKKGVYIVIDNSFIYEENSDEIKVIGYWDTKGRVNILNGATKSKLEKNKGLMEGINYIAQHRRFVAPYGLVDCNIVE